MKLEVVLTKQHWQTYVGVVRDSVSRPQGGGAKGFVLNLVIWMVIGATLMIAHRTLLSSEFHAPTAGFTAVVLALFVGSVGIDMYLHSKRVMKALAPADDGIYVGKHEYEFTEARIRFKADGAEGSYAWSKVRKVERSNGLIMVFLDTMAALLIPEDQLVDPDECHAYLVQYSKSHV